MFHGWSYKCSESPYSYLATKEGYTISSSDGRKFVVKSPGDNELAVADSSLEAFRTAEACIRRGLR